MNEIRYTLLTDGSSDRALIPHLSWLLHQQLGGCEIEAQWADLGGLRPAPKGLAQRITMALKVYACDILFIHRDAERDGYEVRVDEIKKALAGLGVVSVPHVCVIPVRMQEAWLLFDSEALRIAAGNRHGRVPLNLPQFRDIEKLPNPKDTLHNLLRIATEKKGQRLKDFSVAPCGLDVAESIKDFSPLRALPAFQALEAEIIDVIQSNNWNA